MAMEPDMALPVLTSWPCLRNRTPLARPSSAVSLKFPALLRSQTKEAWGVSPAAARARTASQPIMFSQVKRMVTSAGSLAGLCAIHL